jgi:hypothetical protein
MERSEPIRRVVEVKLYEWLDAIEYLQPSNVHGDYLVSVRSNGDKAFWGYMSAAELAPFIFTT